MTEHGVLARSNVRLAGRADPGAPRLVVALAGTGRAAEGHPA